MNIHSDENMISFSGVIPSKELFPTEEFKKIQKKLLENKSQEIFFHSPVTGYKELKEEIKKLMLNRGARISVKDIMVTSGSQQGLDIIVRTVVNSNDVILVEEPTFFGAIELFKSLGAKVVGVPMDEHGIKTDVLEYLIQKHKPKFIYVIPNFHNPTGITMSLDKRYEIIRISGKYGIPIIEDDPYGELTYEGKVLPPLKALDKFNYVLYLSSFSKVISLGLRLGWIIAPERVINKLSMFKQLTDLHVNTLSQNMMCEFLRQGYYEKHIEKIRKEYSFKRDLMIRELHKNFKEIQVYTPQGGFYLWCKFKKEIDINLLLKKAMLNGVNFISGNLFKINDKEKTKFIRLNFTYPKRKEISLGIARLKKSFDEINLRIHIVISNRKNWNKVYVFCYVLVYL